MSLSFHEDHSQPEEQPDGPPPRHYTARLEEAILPDAFLLFRSQPERSAERAAILNAVAAYLRDMDAYWNTRRVRLWFNNNAHASPADLPPSGVPGDTPPRFGRIVRLSDLREHGVGLMQALTQLLSARDVAELPSPPSGASLRRSTALHIVGGTSRCDWVWFAGPSAVPRSGVGCRGHDFPSRWVTCCPGGSPGTGGTFLRLVPGAGSRCAPLGRWGHEGRSGGRVPLSYGGEVRSVPRIGSLYRAVVR
jgi:hypothetical protein